MRKALIAAAAAVFLLAAFSAIGSLSADASFSPSAARAECVIEGSTRRILHEANSEAILPIASTTKILTSVVILDDCRLSDEVIVPKEAAGTEGSSIYLKEGDRYTVEELLYGLMLRSGNDAAVALALYHSGSIEKFAEAMNRKAAFLGASDSHFVNPHGLPDKRHRTTARDLAFIAAYAMENDTFRTIVSTQYYAPRDWKNKNRMLWTYEGADGIKTGFTTEAGKCLVTSAEREGMRVVTVVLGCPDMYGRTEQLLNSAFQTYSLTQLFDHTLPYEGFKVKYDFFYPLRTEERAMLQTEVVLNDPLPEIQGEIAGVIKIFLQNNLIFSQNLYIM